MSLTSWRHIWSVGRAQIWFNSCRRFTKLRGQYREIYQVWHWRIESQHLQSSFNESNKFLEKNCHRCIYCDRYKNSTDRGQSEQVRGPQGRKAWERDQWWTKTIFTGIISTNRGRRKALQAKRTGRAVCTTRLMIISGVTDALSLFRTHWA